MKPARTPTHMQQLAHTCSMEWTEPPGSGSGSEGKPEPSGLDRGNASWGQKGSSSYFFFLLIHIQVIFYLLGNWVVPLFLAILENKIFKLWSPQCVVCFITQNLNPNNIYIRIRSQKHSSLTSDLSWLIFVGDYNQTWPPTTQHQGQSRFSSGVHKLIIWSSFIMTIIIRIIMVIIIISMLWVKAHSNLTQLGVRSNLFRIASCSGNLKDSNITFQIL